MKKHEALQEEYRLAEVKERRTTLMKRIGLWGGIVAGLFLMIYGLAQLGSQQTQPRTGFIQDPVDSSDWVKGNQLAKTTLIEYGDFECPGCAAAYPFTKQLESKYGNQVKFVYRHYPLSFHRRAELAALASEAAGKQGKFWEMHDKLFENQRAWTTTNNPEALFAEYAAALSLDVNQFTADLNNKVGKDKVARDIATGNRASVSATPSFYLNGELVNFYSYDELERAITEAIGQ